MQRILIPLFFVLSFTLNAQVQAELYVDGKASSSLQFRDSLSLIQHVTKLQIEWVNEGFFFSELDSIKWNKSNAIIYLHKGNSFKARIDSFKGKRLQTYLSNQLKSYSNGGYPFATIRLDSTFLYENNLSGKLWIEPGPEIRYDSAYFFDEIKTNKSYIYQLLDIVPGNPFSERGYRVISQKIERSPFLTIQRPTDLSFTDNKAKVFLDVREEASSTFQGVIGLQQVQNGKTTAVGALQLNIQNLFRSGKQFKFSWERFAEESQNLSVFYKHPFFLESKISPSFGFDLLKQDTSFLTRLTSIGVHTFIMPRTELFFQYEGSNGSLLSTSIEAIRNSGLADFKKNLYSLKLSKGHLALLGSLVQKVVWNTTISAGTKSIERNLSLPDTYYDSIQLETNFYRFEAEFAYQIKVMKRQSVYHHVTVGGLRNDELIKNELYRLGGLNSLRGFNEKELFADTYVLSRTEFRSFFENRSYAYVFYDQLFYERRSQFDTPFGLGLGFALATSSGQFTFALATGGSNDQDVSFANIKAHFGYISRF